MKMFCKYKIHSDVFQTHRCPCTVHLVTSLSCLHFFFMLPFSAECKFVGVQTTRQQRGTAQTAMAYLPYGAEGVAKKPYHKAEYKIRYDITTRKTITTVMINKLQSVLPFRLIHTLDATKLVKKCEILL